MLTRHLFSGCQKWTQDFKDSLFPYDKVYKQSYQKTYDKKKAEASIPHPFNPLTSIRLKQKINIMKNKM